MVYKFISPGHISIRTRTEDEDNYINTGSDIWKWKDGGIQTKIDWTSLSCCDTLKEVLKGYLCYRLQTRSLWAIASNDLRLIKILSKSRLSNNSAWQIEDVISFFQELISTEDSKVAYTFRSFYKWCNKNSIAGFSDEILYSLSDTRVPVRRPYANVFLSPNYITPEEENIIISLFTNNYDRNDFVSLRDNVILNLCFELAPRPIQLFSLNSTDFITVVGPDGNKFFSLNLPMAKKMSNLAIEKRPRSVSNALGVKIERLIEKNKDEFGENSVALFLAPKNRNSSHNRLSSPAISKIIVTQLKSIGFKKGDGATLLRHHLAQSLADQGASAEVIAEIMGHNSTLPARAYIAATPALASIKTRALGKNKTYENIMKMLLTGEIMNKDDVSKERWVKGMIGQQYIGGIGSCGLPENTACPKNPVYACYTCNKFHPFKDGPHEEVKTSLQKQAQFFIDIAEKAMDIKHNRPVVQLENTIEAVNAVIARIQNTL